MDATAGQYVTIRNDAVKAMVRDMEKKGWDLASRIRVEPSRFLPTDPDGQLEEGQKEYVVRAQFRKRDIRPLRINLEGLT